MTWLRDNNTNLHRERKAKEASVLQSQIAAITADESKQMAAFENWLDDEGEFKKLSPQAQTALTDYVRGLQMELADLKSELLRSKANE